VLSVAGFFAIVGGFPLGEGFILRGKGGLFHRENPCLFDVLNRTASTPLYMYNSPVGTVVQEAHVQEGTPTGGYLGGIYREVYPP